MTEPVSSSQAGRRDRTGGIVRDKLDLLLDELKREEVPQRLLDLAHELQIAVDEKLRAER